MPQRFASPRHLSRRDNSAGVRRKCSTGSFVRVRRTMNFLRGCHISGSCGKLHHPSLSKHVLTCGSRSAHEEPLFTVIVGGTFAVILGVLKKVSEVGVWQRFRTKWAIW